MHIHFSPFHLIDISLSDDSFSFIQSLAKKHLKRYFFFSFEVCVFFISSMKSLLNNMYNFVKYGICLRFLNWTILSSQSIQLRIQNASLFTDLELICFFLSYKLLYVAGNSVFYFVSYYLKNYEYNKKGECDFLSQRVHYFTNKNSWYFGSGVGATKLY